MMRLHHTPSLDKKNALNKFIINLNKYTINQNKCKSTVNKSIPAIEVK